MRFLNRLWQMRFNHLQRRDFIALLGAATLWPGGAGAQQPGKLPTVGLLGASTAPAWIPWVTPFVQRLRELGWIEGRTVNIEYRWAEGRSDREAEFAAEFARLKVDVIVTVGGMAAKQATSTIPIVAAISADPLGTGLVESLARPGGNLTGFSIQATDLAGKRLELLREMLPQVRRLGIMANFGYTAAVLEKNEVEAAASRLGLEVVTADVRRADDLAPVIEALKGRSDALYVPANAFVNANRIRINALALGAKLPTMFGFQEYVEAGGLMSYGPNIPDLFRRSADLVDKILRGAKPGEMPVEQPTKFYLVVNLKTAKALDLKIPEAFLVRADQVIE